MTLLAVSMIIFSVTEFLPGDAASVMLGQQATPSVLENLRHKMGLDRPAYSRYLGWVIGSREAEGAVFKTNDGGSTWKRVALDMIAPITRTTFDDSKIGWAISEKRIYSTEDGGVRWRRQFWTEDSLNAVAFADAANGLVVGEDGIVYRTTEGGFLSEDQGQLLCAGSTCEEELLSTWNPVESGTELALTDVAFVDINHAWVTGDKGLILFSTDGGLTWGRRNTGVEARLLSVSFIGVDDGVAVGENGTILMTTDGGMTWQRSVSPTSLRLNAVAFAKDGTAWAVGDEGTMLRSKDGGVTWTQLGFQIPLTSALRAVSFHGAFGAAVGADGAVLTTADNGDSWGRQEILDSDDGSTASQKVTTTRPLNGLTVKVSESGDLSAWATSDEKIWQWGLLGGNLGVSPRSGVSIFQMVKTGLRNSAILAVVAFTVAVPTSLAAGVWVGVHPDTKLDRLLSQGSLLTISLPEFVTGILLILLFSSWLEWLPSSSIMLPGEAVWSRPEVLVLPILTITGALFAYILRMARSNVIEVMNSEYVRTAILKGLPMHRVVVRHVLPNALLPTITVIANNVGWMFGGLIIVESIFAYPGIGRLLLAAIDTRDIRLLQSTALAIASVYAFSNLAADLLYGALNPRIRVA